jgi:hypothetical protein
MDGSETKEEEFDDCNFFLELLVFIGEYSIPRPRDQEYSFEGFRLGKSLCARSPEKLEGSITALPKKVGKGVGLLLSRG